MIVIILLATVAAVSRPPVQAVERETLSDGRVIVREVKDEANVDWELRSAQDDLLVSGRIEDGVRTGTWRFRDDEGELRAKGAYRDGVRSGVWKFFDEDGKPLAEGRFVDKRPDGKWKYRPDDTLSGTFQRERGQHGSKAGRYDGLSLNGERHGLWTVWWPRGKKQLEARFVAGRAVGPWQYWHADGTPDPTMFADLRRESDPFDVLGKRVRVAERLLDGQDTSAEPDEPVLPPLAELPRLEAPRSWSTEQDESLQAALREFRSGSETALCTMLIDLGPDRRAALPHLLEGLCALDVTTIEGVEEGTRYESVFEALGMKGMFTWGKRTKPNDIKRNRLLMLRLYSLYSLTADDEGFWDLDMNIVRERAWKGRRTEARKLLLSPPLDAVLPDLGAADEETLARNTSRPDLSALGGAGTTEALQAGLAWLAQHQSHDGRWDGGGFKDLCPSEEPCDGAGSPMHDVGVTSLALLAFLGDGNSTSTGPYADTVRRAVVWLASQQRKKNGRLFFSKASPGGKPVYFDAHMIDHMIAAQALAEASASSPSPVLRAAATEAVGCVEAARNPYGAWRYDVPPNGESDSHATGWAVAALHAAEKAGIDFHASAKTDALVWFDSMTDASTARIGYVIPGSESARTTDENMHYPASKGEALTAAGLFSFFLLGQDPAQRPMMERYAELIIKKPPEWDPESFGCDMYYWYQGTYAMFQMGGMHWKGWNAAMKEAVVDSQRQGGHLAGSWDPVGPWGYKGGRVYATALMSLCLEVYWRHPRMVEAE
jgi:hypothetical protein